MSDDKKETKLDIVMVGTGAGNARFMETLAGQSPSTAPIKDPIEKTPDLVGPHSRAWMCDVDEGRRIKKLDPKDDAALVVWLIEAPWAHPIWHSYALFAVHLRPLPNIPDSATKFYLDGATHEFWIYALNPDKSRHEFLTQCLNPPVLVPTNFAAQFIELTDDLARERIKSAIQMICDGTLSPDTDQTGASGPWAKMFGRNMIKKEFR